MGQALEVENTDKYKSYIQRRRVGTDDSAADFTVDSKLDKSPIADLYETDFFKKESKIHEDFSPLNREIEEKSSYSPYKGYTAPLKHNHRIDAHSYRKNYPASYKGANGTAIEDNRTTLIAIKIIKQALACFAVLGIIVFMQQRNDTSAALEFVKKHVVDNHTDFSGLVAGVENIIAECSRIFGGLP